MIYDTTTAICSVPDSNYFGVMISSVAQLFAKWLAFPWICCAGAACDQQTQRTIEMWETATWIYLVSCIFLPLWTQKMTISTTTSSLPWHRGYNRWTLASPACGHGPKATHTWRRSDHFTDDIEWLVLTIHMLLTDSCYNLISNYCDLLICSSFKLIIHFFLKQWSKLTGMMMYLRISDICFQMAKGAESPSWFDVRRTTDVKSSGIASRVLWNPTWNPLENGGKAQGRCGHSYRTAF